MKTTKITTLTKPLRALSLLYASLGACWVDIPLAILIVSIRQGSPITAIRWPSYICSAAMFALVATVVCIYYRLFPPDKRSSLKTALLWFVVLATAIYSAIYLLGSLRVVVQHL